MGYRLAKFAVATPTRRSPPADGAAASAGGCCCCFSLLSLLSLWPLPLSMSPLSVLAVNFVRLADRPTSAATWLTGKCFCAKSMPRLHAPHTRSELGKSSHQACPHCCLLHKQCQIYVPHAINHGPASVGVGMCPTAVDSANRGISQIITANKFVLFYNFWPMPLTHMAGWPTASMIQYPTTAVASRPICASNLGSGCKLTLIDCI